MLLPLRCSAVSWQRDSKDDPCLNSLQLLDTSSFAPLTSQTPPTPCQPSLHTRNKYKNNPRVSPELKSIAGQWQPLLRKPLRTATGPTGEHCISHVASCQRVWTRDGLRGRKAQRWCAGWAHGPISQDGSTPALFLPKPGQGFPQ